MADPIDPGRQAAALDVARAYGIYPKRLSDGSWQAIQASPGRSGEALETLTYDDPVTALEGALAALQSADTKDRTSRLSRLYDALARGVYAPWPKARQDGSLDFQVVRASDRVVMSTHGGLLSALQEIAALVNEPVPTNGV